MGQLSSLVGSTIHATATAKSRQYPVTGGVALREARGNATVAVKAASAAQRREKSVEIDAQPLSSSDEDTKEQEEKTPEPSPMTKGMRNDFQKLDERILKNRLSREQSSAAMKGRNGQSAGSRPSRKKRLVDDPIEVAMAPKQDDCKSIEDQSTEDARIDSWTQHTPKKRKIDSSKRYYGSQTTSNIHTSAGNIKQGVRDSSTSSITSPSRSARDTVSGFQAPKELRTLTPATHETRKFTMPPEPVLPDRPKIRPSIMDKDFKPPEDPLSPRSTTASYPAFRIPPDSTTSSATTTDASLTIYSHPDSPPLTRSDSASSLSSINSFASLLLTQDEKDELMKDDTNHHSTSPNTNNNLNPTINLTAECPLCLTPVSSILLEEFTLRHPFKSKIHNNNNNNNNSTRLPSRLQQKFCREHRAHSARQTWHERGYPTIDWNMLATTRTTRHLPFLRSLLHQQTRSFYRDALATAAHGSSRRTLLRYLREGVLDVVKYGYYGPRGARVAAEGIMLGLARELEEGAGRDGLLRDAGVAGFVQAVLVPELVGRWVGEDLGEGNVGEAEIRGVLEESAEIGRLVNEDEDQVVIAPPPSPPAAAVASVAVSMSDRGTTKRESHGRTQQTQADVIDVDDM